MKTISVDIFSRFKKEWALLTVKKESVVNSMTIGWGEMGCLWGKNVITIFIKPNQKTYDILQEVDEFYVHFFDDSVKEDLKILGSVSGYECEDKYANTVIQPVVCGDKVYFKEAQYTLVCKKIYVDIIDPKKIVDQSVIEKYYSADQAIHRVVVGEVCEII